MKLIRLTDSMKPLVYLARHWGKWYYIDVNGYLQSVKDVTVKLKEIQED